MYHYLRSGARKPSRKLVARLEAAERAAGIAPPAAVPPPPRQPPAAPSPAAQQPLADQLAALAARLDAIEALLQQVLERLGRLDDVAP